jgi:hypothetical protein
MVDEVEVDADGNPVEAVAETTQPPEDERMLVKRICKTIRDDKEHHDKAFKRMRRDMFLARYGRLPEDNVDFYAANIIGRHVKQKTAALYAKNPKITARRRETIDFQLWDENPQSLQIAFQTIQQAQAMMSAVPTEPDPMTGQMAPAVPVDLPPGFEQAQALMADFQQGMAKRQETAKLGKTLEVLTTHALREQKPLDFKVATKKMVRRTITTCVGYIELGFQREMGPRPGLGEELADARTRLDHLNRLAEEADEGEVEEISAEAAELRLSLADLEQQEEIVLREGLVIDFPASTRVIPDKLCTSLVGFVGARHVTVEYLFTVNEVKELFGVELSNNFKGYTGDGKLDSENPQGELNLSNHEMPNESNPKNKGGSLACVWKHYDKPSGMVYYVCDGHDDFLRPPAAPDVFVEDFWPVYALTFNDVESETELFPPSDAALMLPMQLEYNRARQGAREHRQAARPRWAYANGALEEKDILRLSSMKPFEAMPFNKPDPQTSLKDLLEAIPVPGVDPNLYETNQLFTDIQLVVGTQEAQFGATSSSTATESSIAANSSATADGSAVDDLDSFLSTVARAIGQILLKEMSQEQVTKIVGPGAVWPDLPLSEIAEEIYLEVEAGSTGKPNQAVEINNMKTLLPFLLQMPAIQPTWLARQVLTRMDDRLDLTEAIVEGIPAIVAQNRGGMGGGAAAPNGDPQADPAAQGAEGGDKGPKPPGTTGSDAPMGNNQI